MASPVIIRCECGHVVHGDDERQLLEAAHEHIASAHPDLVGRVTEEDLLAMASAS
jgi:predicted small metal-binding protein